LRNHTRGDEPVGREEKKVTTTTPKGLGESLKSHKETMSQGKKGQKFQGRDTPNIGP